MPNLTYCEFKEIFSSDEISGSLMVDIETCNALEGLLIIKKYLPNSGIEGAGHDVIFACDVEELLNAGITRKDVERLSGLNWMIEHGEYLACFV